MTLQNKFKQWLNTNPSESLRDIQCEIIADDFAIEFAEYVYARPNIFKNGASMKQVLSLFKIEKL